MKIEKYQKKGAAFEFKERQEYFKGQFRNLSLNRFWVTAVDSLNFCKRMEERKTDPFNMELVISQKFYDPQDKYLYDEKDPSIYTIKEVAEYLTAKVYEARIAFTNVGEPPPTSS
jgi:hypothetical protein